MKKEIAKRLNDIADNLPLIWEWELETAEFTGEEMNLSGFGEHQRFDKTLIYFVEVPLMRAVEHKQQIKDAWKNKGDEGVRIYVNEVYRKYRAYENN